MEANNIVDITSSSYALFPKQAWFVGLLEDFDTFR